MFLIKQFLAMGHEINSSYIDLVSRNNGHFIFNLSIFYSLSKVDNFYFNFYCLDSNLNIEKKGNLFNLCLIKVKDKGSYFWTTVIGFYKSVLNNNSKKIIFLTFDNSLHPLLCLLLYPVNLIRKKKITVLLHNNITTFKNVKWKKNLFNFFLKVVQPKIVLLSPFLLEEFKNLFDYDNVHYTFHQNYKELLKSEAFNLNENKLIKNKVIVSLSSSHSKIFSSREIHNHLANAFVFKKKGLIRFVNDNVSEKNESHIEQLSRPKCILDYYSYIYSSDYMFFPLDFEANHRASGVLMDALSVGVSFIGPNTGHFKDINTNFDVGLLYDKYSDLPNIFDSLNKSSMGNLPKILKETNVVNLISILEK